MSEKDFRALGAAVSENDMQRIRLAVMSALDLVALAAPLRGIRPISSPPALPTRWT